MRRNIAIALMVGVLGAAILAGLGTWQVQRLAWKEDIIARIEARIGAEPVALPDAPEEEMDEYRPIRTTGVFLPGELHVLTSARPGGPGYRIVAPFRTNTGRLILVDRGYVPEAQKDQIRRRGAAEIVGNLLWPDEADSYTPAPDLSENIWFARDEIAMAEVLGTEPIMVVLRRSSILDAPRPLPVTVDLPNNHREYAVTWFGLAAVWIAMTAVYVIRARRRTDDTGGEDA
ncbi:MAG: SURF1 family protein [Rubricella sp.]